MEKITRKDFLTRLVFQSKIIEKGQSLSPSKMGTT
jgi:hypothetical protein